MEATGFKLFGKNISYSDSGTISTNNLPVFSTANVKESSGGGYDKHGDFTHGDELRMDETCLKEEDSKRERLIEDQLITETNQENTSSPKAISQSDGNVKPPMITEDTYAEKTETLGDVTDSQREDLKKPDKTIPCIRCNSMDTKFCYYNNYNVKQPRHFCKSCQRYWTAGGTTRNMAVGAGRRKNKNPPPTSHYGFLTVSQSAQIEAPKVISFGPVSPNVDNSGRLSSVSDDCSSGGSTVTTSNSVVVAEKMQDGNGNRNGNGFHSTQQVVVPCINPGVSWSYWNSAVPFPGLCPSGYPPMPFYPSPYWNYIPYVQPSYDQNNAFTLGKRSREAESININPNGGCSEEEVKKQKVSVLIPKTLRINDPDEAAKSSIWSTLGINNESLGTQQGVFNAFQTKHNEESVNRSVLHVNPAALSRSLCFQERA